MFNLFKKIKYKLPGRKIIAAILLGVVITLLGNYLWQKITDYSQSKKALQEELYSRDSFKSDDLRTVEIQTNLMTGSEHKTRIVLIQNFNYFDNVFYFSLSGRSENFSNAYSGILFYDFNPLTKKYEQVYKFIPLDIKKEFFLPGAKEQGIEQIPLLLTSAKLGDIDNDGKVELVTIWSYCNFNHCVWDYPIIIGFDRGYYVKWTMPPHELTDHDINDEYWWGGQIYEREVVNLYDDRKYKINGANFLEYKYLDGGKDPYVVSYNVDDASCWACEHTYLLDVFTPDVAIKALHTFHGSKGLEEHFSKIEDFKFLEDARFEN